VTDARNYPTSTEKEENLGAVMAVIHPNGSRMKYTYSDPADPHYLASSTDEKDNPTYYDRLSSSDPSNPNRVWQIRYPDAGCEQFTYNNFGQILTHQLTSGGTEEFRYDGRGLKTLSWPPVTISDSTPWNNPTHYYYYFEGNIPAGRLDLIDRLQLVVDPLGNATWYDYNKRGQVTRVTHLDGTYTQSRFRPNGCSCPASGYD
jgi:YD repeat-containing protein